MRIKHKRQIIAAGTLLLVLILILIKQYAAPNEANRTSPPLTDKSAAPHEVTLVSSETAFVDRTVRDALADVCSDSSNFPRYRVTREKLEADEKALQQKLPELLQQLTTSKNADYIHTASLFEANREQQISLLAGALTLDPGNTTLLWHGVNACSALRNSELCPLANWESRLLTLDENNSEVWMRVAANRYAEGENDAALDALKRAGAASESNIYWIVTIRLADRAFAAYGVSEVLTRGSLAQGIANRSTPDYRDYTKMCREQSLLNSEWAHACLAYGKQTGAQGRIETQTMIASSIEILALEALGDFENANVVVQRKHKRLQQHVTQSRKYGKLAARLLISNPELFTFSINNIEQHGERDASAYIQDEIERIIDEQPELGCDELEMMGAEE